ncbi:Ricin B lectin domain containing protein [Lactarius tabidus]
MSTIESGQRYKITNEGNGMVFDLSATDGKSILGWTFHGGENQQWILDKQGDGQWTIRSVMHQKYVGFGDTPRNGAAVVGLDRPCHWDIEILDSEDSEDHDYPRVKFWVRSTLLVVEFPKERPELGGPLQLWAAQDERYQVWILEERESSFG